MGIQNMLMERKGLATHLVQTLVHRHANVYRIGRMSRMRMQRRSLDYGDLKICMAKALVYRHVEAYIKTHQRRRDVEE